jgi:hypothetical protein
LWTPPYWGWSGGLFVFHGGYWGPHVGYYGGVNYGFGYMGIGFAGGAWHGHEFAYNTAVVNVNRTVIHNTYIDRTIVRNNTIVNDRHVAFSGGPGGIDHRPTPQENSFAHEQHMAPTSFQTQHEGAARTNTNAYASHNGGHPQNVAMARPMGGNEHPSNNNPHANNMTPNGGHGNMMPNSGHGNQPGNPSGGNNSYRPNQSNPQMHEQNQVHQAPQQPMHEQNQMHQPPPQQSHQPPPQQHESHPAPQPQHQSPPPHNNEHGHR